MKRQTSRHAISMTLADHVQLDLRELMFLRRMAQHCIATNMSGDIGCQALDTLLEGMGVPVYGDKDGPVYGIFEDDRT